ncbi:MAG TPA: GNAT family N-acetyltransferase [Chitinophagaceae bacterium]|nr:GNAT family N-acetyltransferase [Chitinophagaceae bacterium]
MTKALNNPIWNALTGKDQDKNIGTGEVAFLDAEIAPFIGMPRWDADSQRRLLDRVPPGRNWFLLLAEPVSFIPQWEVQVYLPLYQLVCGQLASPPPLKHPAGIVPLGPEHVADMIALTALTRPGPFATRTIEFGNYHGLFRDGRLVAMGGERMHVGECTEVSAICTHPDYRGLGYGAAMTHYLSRLVLEKGQRPFLHARADNVKAVEMYRKLGYDIRCDIHFYIFRSMNG